MVNYACAFSQSQSGKYFECILTKVMWIIDIFDTLLAQIYYLSDESSEVAMTL